MLGLFGQYNQLFPTNGINTTMGPLDYMGINYANRQAEIAEYEEQQRILGLHAPEGNIVNHLPEDYQVGYIPQFNEKINARRYEAFLIEGNVQVDKSMDTRSRFQLRRSDVAVIAEFRAMNTSYKVIAQNFGIPESTLANWFKEGRAVYQRIVDNEDLGVPTIISVNEEKKLYLHFSCTENSKGTHFAALQTFKDHIFNKQSEKSLHKHLEAVDPDTYRTNLDNSQLSDDKPIQFHGVFKSHKEKMDEAEHGSS